MLIAEMFLQFVLGFENFFANFAHIFIGITVTVGHFDICSIDNIFLLCIFLLCSVLAVGTEFTIDPARLSNIGTYHCMASNEMGKASTASMYLEVFKAPKIITPLQPSIMKTEGETGFHIRCNAVGKPTPAVKWFKDGREISPHSTLYEVSTTTQETGLSASQSAQSVRSILYFRGRERIGTNQLMSHDRGHYTCQFENQVASEDSSMLLRVEHSPVVMHRYNKVAFDPGEKALIRCNMQAYPSPKFDWSFGNR